MTGYYINIVGAYGNEEVMRNYVEKHGKQFKQIYNEQLSFLDWLEWRAFDNLQFCCWAVNFIKDLKCEFDKRDEKY